MFCHIIHPHPAPVKVFPSTVSARPIISVVWLYTEHNTSREKRAKDGQKHVETLLKAATIAMQGVI